MIKVYVIAGEPGRNLRLKIVGGGQSKRLTAGTKDWAKAKAMAAELEAELNRDAPAEPDTVGWLMLRRIEDMERDPTKSKHTISSYRHARRRLADTLAPIRCRDLRRRHLHDAQRALFDAGLSASTVKTTMASAAACWRWCEAEGLVEGSWPRVHGVKVSRGSKRPFTDAELHGVLGWVEANEPGLLPVFALLVDTGRRVSEIVTLQGRDVSRDPPILTVRQKGGHVARVPVPRVTMGLVPTVGTHDWVFAGRRRGTHVHRRTPLAVLRRALRDLGVADPERLDVHSFRRSWCASAERAGIPADVGRRVTGHETRAMWEHYQAQAVGDDLLEVVEKVREHRMVAGRWVPATPAVGTRACKTDSAKSFDFKPVDGIEPSTSSLRIEPDPSVYAGSLDAPVPSDRASSGDGVPSGEPVLYLVDPVIRRIVEWITRDPEAGHRLLADAVLRAVLTRELGGAGQEERAG